MSFLSKKNNAISKIATVGGIDNSTNPVTFSVTTGEGSKFPTSNFKVSIDNEIMLCTSRTGDVLTCTRAEESTSMAQHTQGSDVESRITAGTFDEFENIFVKTAATSGADDILMAEQTTAPTNPASGYLKIYPKTDHNIYLLNSDGTESQIPLSAGAVAMSRQAIINGNFDVWQRGTSAATPDSSFTFTADRWMDGVGKDGGTLPTLTRSRQTLTPGDIPNAFYYSRLTTNGAGTSLGVNAQHSYSQKIEHGTRLLCGNGKKVTVSFWARSDIANKRLGLSLVQNYGTGGSPTAQENIVTFEPITLTSTWTKYTATFTTNTLAGKTFGTDNNDHLRVLFYNMWGSTIGNTWVHTGVSAETYVGSGNIDIAQVQLCAGDVALPFQPKSFEEELRACQRYCFVLSAEDSSATVFTNGQCYSTSAAAFYGHFPVKMRSVPTCTTSGNFGLSKSDTSVVAVTGINTTGQVYKHGFAGLATGASGLTAGNATRLISNSDTSAKMTFDAEL